MQTITQPSMATSHIPNTQTLCVKGVPKAHARAVRAAVADRLNGETRGELVESALRVRRELLKKLTGELRYLEQRARREARAGLGVRGKHTASSAAARRDASGTRERRVVDARSERRR